MPLIETRASRIIAEIGVPSGQVLVASIVRYGLLKQILCSWREVIPLIGLGGRKRVQVRKQNLSIEVNANLVPLFAQSRANSTLTKKRTDYLFSIEEFVTGAMAK